MFNEFGFRKTFFYSKYDLLYFCICISLIAIELLLEMEVYRKRSACLYRKGYKAFVKICMKMDSILLHLFRQKLCLRQCFSIFKCLMCRKILVNKFFFPKINRKITHKRQNVFFLLFPCASTSLFLCVAAIIITTINVVAATSNATLHLILSPPLPSPHTTSLPPRLHKILMIFFVGIK